MLKFDGGLFLLVSASTRIIYQSVLTQTVPVDDAQVSQHSLMLFTITVLKFDFLQVKKNNKKPAQTISNNVTMQREEDKKIIIAKKNIKRENNW